MTKKSILFVYDITYKDFIKPIIVIFSIFFLLCVESYIHYIINYNYEPIITDNYNDFNQNNGINFPQDDVTLVTAYYRFRSKHRIFYYNEWMRNFLRINKSIIFFLEKSNFKKILYKRPKEYLNKTIWVFANNLIINEKFIFYFIFIEHIP